MRAVALTGSAFGALLLASSCGFGTAGIAALADGGSGGSNAPPSLGGLGVQGLRIEQPKQSPARIRLLLSDAESDPATVELAVVVPGRGEQKLSAVAANPVTLATSRDGTAHDIAWDFAREPGLPGDGSFVDGVKVIVRVQGGASRELVVGLGNDAPSVAPVAVPGAEVSGVVPIRFTVRDTSDDAVDVKVEFQIDGEAGWLLAHPGGLASGAATPEFAFEGVTASRAGSGLVFFWDTRAPGQLARLERDVRVRFTARDAVVAGAPVSTAMFCVDNNTAPVVQVEGATFGTSPDTTRGIPIPYTVFDEEGDPVRVVFQWRAEDEPGFPALPSDPAEVEALLRDPVRAEQMRICTPLPSYARGVLSPVDARHVRLPELRAGEARVLSRRIDELRLEVLRPSTLSPLAGTWRSNPLRGPVAALALDAGRRALVLDADAVGATSRLLELELATGGVLRTIVRGLRGAPSALSVEPRGAQALVATAFGGTWLLHRIDLRSGAVVASLDASACTGTCPSGALRAVESIGASAAIATAEDDASGALWRLDWTVPEAPRSSVVVRGLATPWGVARDPLCHGRVFVAEHAADRIVAVDLAARSIETVRTGASQAGPAFPRVTSLATSRGGARLIALCQPAGNGDREVRGFDLGIADSPVFALGEAPAGAASATVDRGGVLLVAARTPRELLAANGVEQVRGLVAYDPATAIATAAADFDPPLGGARAWRIELSPSFDAPLHGSPDGASAVFVWDGREAREATGVSLQATCFDTEQGTVARTSREVAGPFVPTVTLGDAGNGLAGIITVDLDGDGDLDLVTGDRPSPLLRLLYQEAPRTFAAGPLLESSVNPVSVIAADLDGDGAVDLVGAGFVPGPGGELVLHHQDAPRAFERQAIVIGGQPSAVIAVDVDGDGDLDLVACGASGQIGALTILDQIAPRTYVARPPIEMSGHPVDVASADIDGDGDSDLVVASSVASRGELILYLQRASGFDAMPPLLVGEQPRLVRIADLDGDGDADLACALRVGGVACFYQEAPGVFGAAERLPVEGQPRSLVVADLDGDGDLDLTSTLSPTGAVVTWESLGPRRFGLRYALPTGFDASISAGDLDGDGQLDLACAVSATGGVTLCFQDPPPTFATSTRLQVAREPGFVAATDLDADGLGDIVVANRQGHSLSVWFQDARRVFTPGEPLPTGVLPSSVTAADLDGDGDLDLVCPNSASDDLSVFWQTAPRRFEVAPRVPLLVYPAFVAVADLDGDGAADLACAGRGSQDVTLCFQDAPRSFGSRVTVKVGEGPQGLAIADLDGDGDLDIACACATSGELIVAFQTAPRTFEPRLRLPTGFGCRSVAAADLDGDGDIDLASVDGRVRVFLQMAPGEFSPVTELELNALSSTIVAVDVDSDGLVDLAVGTARRITVFLQDAPLRFTPHDYDQPGTLAQFRPVAATDMDGDGDVDLVTATSNTDSATILWGR